MCRPKDLEESLELAEKLKVLKIVVSDDTKVATEENTAAGVKQSRKMVNMALDRYVSNMGADMGKHLSADNRSELNKIFQIYRQLDLTEDGIEVYLGYVTEKLAPELEGAKLPFPTSREEIPDLRLYLHETLIPNATKLIS